MTAQHDPVQFTDLSGGDLMTLEEFHSQVRIGSLIDYDGFGYFATATRESDVLIRPSLVFVAAPPHWATHVVWYNR